MSPISSTPSSPRSKVSILTPSSASPSWSGSSTPTSSDDSISTKPSTSFNYCAHDCNTLILDLKDIIFSWSPSVSTKLLRRIVRTDSWADYEKGTLTEREAYEAAAVEANVRVSEIQDSIQAVRSSLRMNNQLVDLVRDLRSKYPDLHVYAMSNVSSPDENYLHSLSTKSIEFRWEDLFDDVFTSSEACACKPELAFFSHVFAQTKLDSSRTVFVDSKFGNILAARASGLHTVLFDDIEVSSRLIRNAIGNPISRGEAWLKENARRLTSITDSGKAVDDTLSQLFIYELTGDESLVSSIEEKGIPLDQSACDIDLASVTLSIVEALDPATRDKAMDVILKEMSVLQTSGLDPCVCANVLALFFRYNRGHELRETLDWVYHILENRAYLDGSSKYFTGDAFLFFVSRFLVVETLPRNVYSKFYPVFAERVSERVGTAGDALSLSLRILAGSAVDIYSRSECARLRTEQECDGSFPLCFLYRPIDIPSTVGNKGLTTAFAIAAIKVCEAMEGGDY